LIIHAVIYTLVVLSIFAGSVYISKKGKPYSLLLLCLSLILGLSGYFLSIRPDLFTKILPFSWAIFYSNLYPFAAALFIPVAIRRAKTRFQKARIIILCAALFVITLIPFRDYLSKPPKIYDSKMDENGVCLQTSSDTCSAASIVTLLGMYGIKTTEAEASLLALTKEGRGTDRLGIYRALKILTSHDKKFHVRIEKLTADELIRKNKPAIITVGLVENPSTPQEKEMAARFNWQPGAVHDVVFMGKDEKDPSRARIGEPQFGLERWPRTALDSLFKNIAIFPE